MFLFYLLTVLGKPNSLLLDNIKVTISFDSDFQPLEFYLTSELL